MFCNVKGMQNKSQNFLKLTMFAYRIRLPANTILLNEIHIPVIQIHASIDI